MELITIANGVPTVGIKEIAHYSGNKVTSIKNRIRQYENELTELCEFSVRQTNTESFLRKYEYTTGNNAGNINWNLVRLNEPQAMFIMSLLDNTDKIVAFKFNLVSGFHSMRTELITTKTKLLEIEHKQALTLAVALAVENAKKLNTYTIDNIDVISIRKYRQEYGTLYTEKFLWSAMEYNNMARTITRVTQFRRLPEHLIVTDGKTTNEHKTPLYTVEAIDKCVATYLTHLASLVKDKS